MHEMIANGFLVDRRYKQGGIRRSRQLHEEDPPEEGVRREDDESLGVSSLRGNRAGHGQREALHPHAESSDGRGDAVFHSSAAL